ncbi:hypothetical protein [Pseudomonas donghuensis]|uniref:hypothetical protein n=1 Tax=Pseudomonas donghuensis TaxID=1163398 RepID=UPI000299D082|nr:hypothetical protein [Pseudomonas donghuensis]PJY96932.1 hypothetical protein COO64_08825 [Pseudomonas donghuensis]WKY30379.1 hypothetical protein QYF67_10475 [Pseudomonas donghuensis]
MDSLVKRRIILSVSALAGFLPVTLVFIWGALYFLAGTLGSSPIVWENLLVVLVPIAFSLFCLWACWKLYAISIATTPEVRHKRLLVMGVLGTILWGLPWAYLGRDFPTTIYIFLMPGLTAAVMLGMALSRQRSAVTRARPDA